MSRRSCSACGAGVRRVRAIPGDRWICAACGAEESVGCSPDERTRRAIRALRRPDPSAWPGATDALASASVVGLDAIVSRVRSLGESQRLLTGVAAGATVGAALSALACSVWTFVLPARNLDRPPETLERSLVQVGLVLFMVLLAAVPFVVVPLGRRRVARELEVILDVWTKLTSRLADASAVGALARAHREPLLRHAAHAKFVELAASVTDEVGEHLPPADIDSVARLLRAEGDWPLVSAAVRVLSHAVTPRGASELESFASRARRSGAPEDLLVAASEAAAKVRSRAASGRDVRSLLRQSSPDQAQSDTLLRSAPSGGEPPQQLLREGEAGDDE